MCRLIRGESPPAPALWAAGVGVSESDAADLFVSVGVPTCRLSGQPAPPHAISIGIPTTITTSITTTEKGNVRGRRQPEGP
jgi:hypothetical protein